MSANTYAAAMLGLATGIVIGLAAAADCSDAQEWTLDPFWPAGDGLTEPMVTSRPSDLPSLMIDADVAMRLRRIQDDIRVVIATFGPRMPEERQ